MRSSTTDQAQQPHWKHGTDLRDDATGIYRWPHPAFIEERPDLQTIVYPSVTTVLDEFMGSGMRHAEHWFTAEYVKWLAEQAKAKEKVPVWIDADNVDGGEEVLVSPTDLMLNKLPGDFGLNFGMHWIKKAGPREMRKRANRGSILHDALEDRAYGLTMDDGDVGDYCTQLIQARDFRLDRDYVEPYVRQLMRWFERHVVEILMAEAMVMNDTWNYAGTLDIQAQLRGYPELDAIGPVGVVDAKGSKQDQPSHELQGAAYFYGEYMGVPGTAERLPLTKVDWMANLYVQPDKVTLRHWPRIIRCEDPQECVPFHSFLHARVLWEAMYSAEHPKTMKPVAVRAEDMKLPKRLVDQLAQGALPS